MTTTQDTQSPNTTPVPPQESTSSSKMILTMGLIGLLCGILIVSTFQVTQPIIERNKTEALERAIFEVVPGAVRKTTFEPVDGHLQIAGEIPRAREKYYACYDADGKLAGVALEATGQGFQDAIHVLYGYSPDRRAIVGMKVLESRETPGLGDKIESDPAFQTNFDALDVDIDPDTGAPLHPIELVKPGKKTDAWQIEAITGATISSRAIANILRASAETHVPVLVENLEALEAGE